ncbi:hypothetical protein CWI36_0031p0050 [Hamiltosporidium magnivora]|uniref:Uncharacterized protein n=2 Tax=Hamiltosporidium TaxID=1176354 RepID=A0A4Q9LM27_9MICR|nr:hypothetical protein CWI36_0031p0050 [Hamiltosporidium magnivora]
MTMNTDDKVIFLSDITLEEEYEILQSIKRAKPVEIPPVVQKRICGNSLLDDKDYLFQSINFLWKEQIYDRNSALSSIVFCLLACEPFSNLLKILSTKNRSTKKFFPLAEILSALIDFLEEEKDSKSFNEIREKLVKLIPDGDKKDSSMIYKSILDILHKEFLSSYYFEEVDWEIQEEEKLSKIHIYEEYSPIVEIFQGKFKCLEKELKIKYFESLNIKQSSKDEKIEKILEMYEVSTDKGLRYENDIIKGVESTPIVLVANLNSAKNDFISKNIKFAGEKYKLVSVLSKSEDSYISYVLSGTEWICCLGKPSIFDSVSKFKGFPLMAFYVKNHQN